MKSKIEFLKGLYAIAPNASLASLYLQGGARLIQYRNKEKNREEQREELKTLIALREKTDFCLIVNDYPDLAREFNADGVHLGQDDLSPHEARDMLGSDMLIGISTHSYQEFNHAKHFPVDYIACGAIFPTTSKPKSHPVVGVSLLEQVVAESPFPIVAIGGITKENGPIVKKTGVAMIALLSALANKEDVVKEVAWWVDFYL